MKKVFRLTVGILFLAPVFIVLSVLAIVIGWLFRVVFRAENFSYKLSHAILSVLIAWIYLCLGMRVHVDGRNKLPGWGASVLYVPNHSSILDIPVLFSSGMWCGIVAKKEVYKVPLLHGLLNLLRCVPIDRGDMRASMKAISEGSKRIKNGYPMAIFPEGTRSKTGKIAEFKAGSFKMATRVGAPIYPVAMKNTRKAFEDIDSLRIVHVYVKILDPVQTEGLGLDEQHELPSLVRGRIEEAWNSLPGPDGR